MTLEAGAGRGVGAAPGARTGAPGAATEVACWPPVRTVTTSDGWLVGLSGGFTRRANSAVVLTEPTDVRQAVDEVERVFAAAGLPAVVRIGRGERDALAAELDRRGWRARAGARVLARHVDGTVAPAAERGDGSDGPIEVVDAPDDAWLDLYLATKGPSDVRALARTILTGGRAQHVAARVDGVLVGIVRVAFADGWAGLSCLAVDPGRRRRGLGRRLTVHGLAVAHRAGVDRVFLQVEEGNSAVGAWYAQLGFREVDDYRYREARGGAGR